MEKGLKDQKNKDPQKKERKTSKALDSNQGIRIKMLNIRHKKKGRKKGKRKKRKM